VPCRGSISHITITKKRDLFTVIIVDSRIIVHDEFGRTVFGDDLANSYIILFLGGEQKFIICHLPDAIMLVSCGNDADLERGGGVLPFVIGAYPL